MLHETSVAPMRSSALSSRSRVVAVADPEARRRGSPSPRPRAGPRRSCPGVIAPEPRPAIAVTILNTEPGTYRPCVARGRSGWARSSWSASNARCDGRRVGDRGRVVRRGRGQGEDLAGPRVEHDDRAACLPSAAHRGPLELARQGQVRSLGSYGSVPNLRSSVAQSGRRPGRSARASYARSRPARPYSRRGVADDRADRRRSR